MTGLSICSAVIDGGKYLVAFGGYNGKYNNEVFVMKLKPRDLSHPKIFQSPAAAAAAASVTAAYALAKSEKLEFPQIIDLNFNAVEKSVPQKDINTEIDAIKEEKALETSIEEVKAENSRLREKIDELKSNHTELSKELQYIREIKML
ncbi:acyl-CoA-binding domain-containing protein 6-like [Hibiscus syriacus]|uniref:acyl-CoA-binding domain-containing protein 6-like n=1 Tax=Hibiscus syriacus TaxID=106335 RepID=UPI0019232F5F|nr:acyl-CoA-binding domain-containing protein 6-like [Hibiscus syriacus]